MLKNVPDNTLQLTVNADGVVSLWDSPEQAEQAASTVGEVYTALLLGPMQLNQLECAATEAQELRLQRLETRVRTLAKSDPEVRRLFADLLPVNWNGTEVD